MGYNARNDEIRDNITRMRREWEATKRGSLATAKAQSSSVIMNVAEQRVRS
jgi:hypothetical protein